MDRDELIEQHRPQLEALAKQRFAFLVDEMGFRRGRTTKNVWFTQTYYLHDTIGVSVMIQYHDPVMQVLLIRTQQRKLLPDWNQTAVGYRWRRGFERAVHEALGVQDERLTRLSALESTRQPWTPATFEALIAIYSDLVRDHVEALRALPLERLFPAPTRRS
jgi:hypothetical protein